jgi:hypothetical protein
LNEFGNRGVLQVRKIIAGAMSLALGGVGANAADFPAYRPLVPVVPAVYNWTGIYLGVNVGYGVAQATESSTFGFSSSEQLSGAVGGGHFGGNYQTGAFVIGLEVDGMLSGQKKTTTTGYVFFPITIEDKVTWLTTARVRVGGAIDRVLLYATAGGRIWRVHQHGYRAIFRHDDCFNAARRGRCWGRHRICFYARTDRAGRVPLFAVGGPNQHVLWRQCLKPFERQYRTRGLEL